MPKSVPTKRKSAHPEAHAPATDWAGARVVVTGGASFIGSHLAEALLERGARVVVVDDLSSGRLENLAAVRNHVKFVKLDLEYCRLEEAASAFDGAEAVFHLAAVHGGRGYIDTHPADVCSNFAIDHHVFEAARKADVGRVVSASSACVYPPSLQSEEHSEYKLRESDLDPRDLLQPLSSDLEYGWAKTMGEVQLLAFIKQYGLKGCSVRFVTAYGPRENETHAVIALIYKALARMDPYEIWGNGRQDRDLTYVADIVSGTLRAAERITDGRGVNIGTGRRYTILEVAETIFELVGWHPKAFTFDLTKPTGVVSRALDISMAREVLGWEPKFSLREGLEKTIEWYRATHLGERLPDARVLLERA
ncbi:MAG TPA: NAD-dependent epimerase/dehydratase family protein [Thermoplasmata archaeon]|nr:NAD-dependent epimerase/dehydratase family protein [Thermoplasmata archaeon]